MEVVAYAFSGAQDPVREGVVRIGELTTVLGRNDSGKSRLVRGFATALNGGDLPRMTADGLAHSSAIYARATATERDDLLRTGITNSPRPPDPRARATIAERWAASLLPDLPQPDRELLEGALLASQLFGFTAASDGRWRCWWCLPPIDRLDANVAEAARRHLRAPGVETGIYMLARHSAPVDASAPPSCMWQPGVPIAALLLGVAPVGALPAPRFVPSGVDQALDEAASLIGAVMRYVHWSRAAQEDLQELSELDEYKAADDQVAGALRDALEELVEAPDPSEPGEGWAIEDDDGSTVRREPAVVQLCKRMTAGATDALPPYVRDRYHVRVAPRSLMSAGAPLAARGIETSTGSEFVPEVIADGLQVWIELALRKGIDELRDVAAQFRQEENSLRALAEEFPTLAEQRSDAWHAWQDGEEDEGEDERRGEYEYLTGEVVAQSGTIKKGAKDILAIVASLEGETTAPATSGSYTALARSDPLLRHEFYLVDEPERHLHARLQRAASRYLVDFTRQSAAQAIVITHSVAFMRAGGNAITYLYVRRGPQDSKVISVDPRELEALNEVTRELGLDRGELLAAYTVILFVEGRSDQYVLESLFGPRLRAAGIAVAPIHGILRTRGIVEADLLMRFHDARIAFLIDDVQLGDLKEIFENANALEAAAHSSHPETRAIARLIQDARANHRHVEPFGIPKHDIFDLLDDGAIRQRFPSWPDHETARLEYEAAREKQRLHRKAFYEQAYGIPRDDVMYFAEVTDAMRASPPAALCDVMDELERYAMPEVP